MVIILAFSQVENKLTASIAVQQNRALPLRVLPIYRRHAHRVEASIEF